MRPQKILESRLSKKGILVVKVIFYSFGTLIHKVLFALLEIKDHRAAFYSLCLIVSSVFQVPDEAIIEDSSNFGTSSEASSSGNCLVTVRL